MACACATCAPKLTPGAAWSLEAEVPEVPEVFACKPTWRSKTVVDAEKGDRSSTMTATQLMSTWARSRRLRARCGLRAGNGLYLSRLPSLARLTGSGGTIRAVLSIGVSEWEDTLLVWWEPLVGIWLPRCMFILLQDSVSNGEPRATSSIKRAQEPPGLQQYCRRVGGSIRTQLDPWRTVETGK